MGNAERAIIARAIVGVLLSALAVLVLCVWVNEARGATVDQVFGDGFEQRSGEGGPPPDPCDSPLVMPEGFAPVYKSWAQCFTPRDGQPVPIYPESLGFPVPLGANRGEWTSCEFQAQPNQTVNLFWDGAQANPGQGYFTARTARSMWISVSACPGDFRYVQGCALMTNTGTIVTSTKGVPNPNVCSLTPNEWYFMTIAPVDPSDGLDPAEDTCNPVPSSANGCDVQARSTVN